MRLRNPERALLVAGALVAGLTIRLYLLTSSGTQDVSFDVGWGHAINNAGFADYYNGNYFPLQYHVFQLAAWMSDRLSIGGPTALKSLSLVADAGIAVTMFALAQRIRISGGIAVVYWLMPYTLAMAWLGYVDFEMALLALLAVLLIASSQRPVVVVLAGFCLGGAVLMKPQALILLLALAGLVGLGAFFSSRRVEVARFAVSIGIGPLALFIGYSAWLASAHRGFWFLAKTMLDFDKFQGAALSANMTNIWIAFAEAYRHGNQAASTVTGPHFALLQATGIVTTVALLVGGTFVVARRIDSVPPAETVLAVFALGTMAVPSLLTRGHENHFFLGAVFGLLAAHAFSARGCVIAIHVMLAIQFVVLISLYGFGENGPHPRVLARWNSFFFDHQRVLWSALGIVSFAAFAVACTSLLRAVHRYAPVERAPSNILMGGAGLEPATPSL